MKNVLKKYIYLKKKPNQNTFGKYFFLMKHSIARKFWLKSAQKIRLLSTRGEWLPEIFKADID